MFEALNWAASIAYYLKDQGRPRLPRAAAVMWIRGRVQHKWAEAIELRPIFIGPITSNRSGLRPGPFLFWHWRKTNEIPDADAGHENPDGADAYGDLLAGKPVREALDDIERALNTKQ